MFEEKWWKPKTFEQLEKEEKSRQFNKWIINKCMDIVNYASCSNNDYYSHIEKDGYMYIISYTKSPYESCRFREDYKIPIDEFWDSDNLADINIVQL
jgi:hypothetical protein